MALSNLFGWNQKMEAAPAAACGSAYGAAGKPEEKPAACGSACGAGDKPAETPAACGAADKPDGKPSACGSACGASDKYCYPPKRRFPAGVFPPGSLEHFLGTPDLI